MAMDHTNYSLSETLYEVPCVGHCQRKCCLYYEPQANIERSILEMENKPSNYSDRGKN